MALTEHETRLLHVEHLGWLAVTLHAVAQVRGRFAVGSQAEALAFLGDELAGPYSVRTAPAMDEDACRRYKCARAYLVLAVDTETGRTTVVTAYPRDEKPRRMRQRWRGTAARGVEGERAC